MVEKEGNKKNLGLPWSHHLKPHFLRLGWLIYMIEKVEGYWSIFVVHEDDSWVDDGLS
jgi:hypothetical protein